MVALERWNGITAGASAAVQAVYKPIAKAMETGKFLPTEMAKALENGKFPPHMSQIA